MGLAGRTLFEALIEVARQQELAKRQELDALLAMLSAPAPSKTFPFTGLASLGGNTRNNEPSDWQAATLGSLLSSFVPPPPLGGSSLGCLKTPFLG